MTQLISEDEQYIQIMIKREQIAQTLFCPNRYLYPESNAKKVAALATELVALVAIRENK